MMATSQDAAKDVACAILGTVNIMPFAVYGKNIGVIGIHERPETYNKGRYANTVMYDKIVQKFEFPDAPSLERMASQISDIFKSRTSDVTVAGISNTLSIAEHKLVKKHLTQSKKCLEFGSGEITITAILDGTLDIISVDSDKFKVAALQSWLDSVGQEGGRLHRLVHANIGEVGDYGNPKAPVDFSQWQNYISEAWNEANSVSMCPDLVILAGRFRVACGLSVIVSMLQDCRALERVRVIIRNCGNERPYYNELLEWFDLVEEVDTVRVMKVREDLKIDGLLQRLLFLQFDQR